jgi:C-terminal processing protease CtpA/Prc
MATVFTILRDSFVTQVENPALAIAAIKGMVRQIDPEGGEYFTEEEFKAFVQALPRKTRDGCGAQRPGFGDQPLSA